VYVCVTTGILCRFLTKLYTLNITIFVVGTRGKRGERCVSFFRECLLVCLKKGESAKRKMLCPKLNSISCKFIYKRFTYAFLFGVYVVSLCSRVVLQRNVQVSWHMCVGCLVTVIFSLIPFTRRRRLVQEL